MEYIILSVSVVNFLVGVIVLIHAKHTKENIVFLLFTLAVSIWAFNNYLLRLNPSVEWLRIAYALGVMVTTLGLFWVWLFLGNIFSHKSTPFIILFSGLLFYLTIFSDKIIYSLYAITPFGYDGKLGELFYVYSLYFGFLILKIIHDLSHSREHERNPIRKKQISNVFYGSVTFALISFVVSFLIPTFYGTLAYTALDNFSFSIFLALIAYGIIEYRLFNIKIIATELAVFGLWAFFFFRILLLSSDRILNTALFLVSIGFGAVLIRSVINEVEQRERIEKLAKELEAANERLKELDQLKSEFVSMATHQIRGPLTAIKGYASMILQGDLGAVPENLKGTINTISESSNALTVIVGDFLDISRIEQGSMKYDFTVFDLSKLVQSIGEELAPTVERKGLRVKLEIEPSIMVYADAGKVRQVVGNLIDNAIKYTPAGSITVSLKKEGGLVRLAVKDTGVGINPETLSKLFQKFSRAEDASKANIHGTGLGLYVAKKLIEAQSGRIWAESDGEGKGSTFSVELPLA